MSTGMWTPWAVLLVVSGVLPAGAARKDFSLRLGYNTTNSRGTSGRLDVYLRGNWTPVCGAITIDDNQAKVVCRELGLPSVDALAIPGNYLFPWDNNTHGENLRFKCQGTEKHLAECVKLESHVCDGPVAVVCSSVRDYRLRLVGGDRKVGRLEVMIGNVWGTVCDAGFSYREATVVCPALGINSHPDIVWPNEGFGEADQNTIIWPYQFSCRYGQTSLDRCSRRRSTSVDCTHDTDVAVSCRMLDEIPFSMRLMGGASNNSGRLEVFVNGEWGTVCGNGFSSKSARVACRQMGLPYVQADVLSTYTWPSVTGPIFLDGVSCFGFEPHILYCAHNALGLIKNCSHDMDVVIECKEKDEDCGQIPTEQTTEVSHSASRTDVAAIIFGSVTPVLVLSVAAGCVYNSKRARRERATRFKSIVRRESMVRWESNSLGLGSRLTVAYIPQYNHGVFYTNNSSAILSPNRRSTLTWAEPLNPPSTPVSGANFIGDPPSYAELFSKGDGQTPSQPPPPYETVTSSWP